MAFGTFSSQEHEDFLLNVNLCTKLTAEPINHIQKFEFLREKHVLPTETCHYQMQKREKLIRHLKDTMPLLQTSLKKIFMKWFLSIHLSTAVWSTLKC